MSVSNIITAPSVCKQSPTLTDRRPHHQHLWNIGRRNEPLAGRQPAEEHLRHGAAAGQMCTSHSFLSPSLCTLHEPEDPVTQGVSAQGQCGHGKERRLPSSMLTLLTLMFATIGGGRRRCNSDGPSTRGPGWGSDPKQHFPR